MKQYRFPLLSLTVIALLAVLLYTPYLGNDFIFDDHGLFANGSVYDYVERPFDFLPRSFPYFTLGIIAVISKGIELNRIFSLILHIMCGWMLYVLLRALLLQAKESVGAEQKNGKESEPAATLVALIGACWFVIHPIAVYGAGYLAQRTILFATLFSLLSLWFYRRAFSENRIADIFTAALFYSLAVFSKEHAIMVPFASISLISLYEGSFRSRLKRVALYLALCAPAAISVFFAKRQVVATGYEPDIATIISQISDISLLSSPVGKWAVSAVLQTRFFFEYLFLWLVPDIRKLSIDMRFDFSHIWFSWSTFPIAIFFFLSPLWAIYFLRRKGTVALFCCGYLYVWFLYLTELASVRFQEPFVLYRCYLLAPGYVMMLAAICTVIPRRFLIVAGGSVIFILFFLAQNRLNSFENESTVWKDAAQKLQTPSLPGSDRIFYNRGRAFLQEKKYRESINDFSQAIQQNQHVSQLYVNRSLAYYMLNEDKNSRLDIDQALLLDKKNSTIYYVRGLILERQGCIAAATHSYDDAIAFGNPVAKMKLEQLSKKIEVEKKQVIDPVMCPIS